MKWVLLLLALVLGSSSSSAQMVFRWPWPGQLEATYTDTIAVLTPWKCATAAAWRVSKYVSGVDSTWVGTGWVVGARGYVYGGTYTFDGVGQHPADYVGHPSGSNIAILCRPDSVTAMWPAAMNVDLSASDFSGLIIGFTLIKPGVYSAPRIGKAP